MVRKFIWVVLLLYLSRSRAKASDSLTVIFMGDFPKGKYYMTYKGKPIFKEELNGDKIYILRINKEGLKDGDFLPLSVWIRYPLKKGIQVLAGLPHNSCSSYLLIHVDYKVKKKYLLSFLWSNAMPERALDEGVLYKLKKE